jgi:hypothetical protein
MDDFWASYGSSVLAEPYDGNVNSNSGSVVGCLRPQNQHKGVSTSDNEQESDGKSEGSENDMTCGSSVLEEPYDGNVNSNSGSVVGCLRPQNQHKGVSTSDNEQESDGGSKGSDNDMKCGGEMSAHIDEMCNEPYIGEMSAHIDEMCDEPYIDENAEDSESSSDYADLLDDAADRGRQDTPDKMSLEGGAFWDMLMHSVGDHPHCTFVQQQSNLVQPQYNLVQSQSNLPMMSKTKKTRRGGARRVSRTEMRNRSLSAASISAAATKTGISEQIIRQCREERFSMHTMDEELQWMWGKLRGSVELSNNQRQIRYKLANGEVVGRMHFTSCYDLGMTRFYELRRRALDPNIHQAKPESIKGMPAGLRYSNTELYMAAYLESFIMLYADEQPNTGHRHLDPVKFGEIWSAYKISCKLRGKCHFVGSYDLLNKVWRHKYLYRKDLSIRRNKGVRGGLCIDCAEIKIMGDRAHTQEQKDEYSAASQAHRHFHGTERSLQYQRMHDCEMDPDKKDVLFCDIWDISKNIVPVSKYGKIDGAVGDTAKNCVRNRIQGIMSHGAKPKLWLYKSLPTVSVSTLCYTIILSVILVSVHRKGRI